VKSESRFLPVGGTALQISDTISRVIFQQQMALMKLQEQLRMLTDKLRAAQPSNVASQAEETPPPHY